MDGGIKPPQNMAQSMRNGTTQRRLVPRSKLDANLDPPSRRVALTDGGAPLLDELVASGTYLPFPLAPVCIVQLRTGSVVQHVPIRMRG